MALQALACRAILFSGPLQIVRFVGFNFKSAVLKAPHFYYL